MESTSNSYSLPPQNPYYNSEENTIINQNLSKSCPSDRYNQSFDSIHNTIRIMNPTEIKPDSTIGSLEFEKTDFETFYKNHQNRMSIDNSLINIKIISEIKACQKYVIQNGFVFVCFCLFFSLFLVLIMNRRYLRKDTSNSLLQFLWRTYNDDNRYKTIEFIEKVICDFLYYFEYKKKQLIEYDIEKIMKDIERCKNGLRQLEITYQNDDILPAKVKLINQKIDKFLLIHSSDMKIIEE